MKIKPQNYGKNMAIVINVFFLKRRIFGNPPQKRQTIPIKYG
jgi:hypothetical protein